MALDYVLPAPQIAHKGTAFFPKKKSQSPLIIILNSTSDPELRYDLRVHQWVFKLPEH